MPTYRNDTEENIYGLKNKDDRNALVVPSGTIETYKIYNIAGLTKTLDTPYYKLVGLSEVFATPGTKTGLIEFKVIRLTALADGITVKANVAANPYALSLISDTAIDIENNGEIGSLVFVGTGSVKIEGF